MSTQRTNADAYKWRRKPSRHCFASTHMRCPGKHPLLTSIGGWRQAVPPCFKQCEIFVAAHRTPVHRAVRYSKNLLINTWTCNNFLGVEITHPHQPLLRWASHTKRQALVHPSTCQVLTNHESFFILPLLLEFPNTSWGKKTQKLNPSPKHVRRFIT